MNHPISICEIKKSNLNLIYYIIAVDIAAIVVASCITSGYASDLSCYCNIRGCCCCAVIAVADGPAATSSAVATRAILLLLLMSCWLFHFGWTNSDRTKRKYWKSPSRNNCRGKVWRYVCVSYLDK